MTSPVSDLPPHAQNAIVGRFLGFRALAPVLSTIELNGHQDAASHLKYSLFRLTNNMLDNPDTRQSSVEFLKYLAGKLADALEDVDEAAQPAAQPVLDELYVLVAEYEAAPYDPLGRLAKAAARTAADYYQAFGAEVRDGLWQSTFLGFSFVRGKIVLSYVDTIHVQLWTEFGEDEKPTATVMVKVAPRWLDEETIAVLPRSLLHEYVAHVPQGPHSRRRQHPDPSDMFAEGWMDYIAHCIFRAVLERRGPSRTLGDALDPNWISLHEQAAEHFFVARCTLADGARTAAARSEGVAAARQLHDLLRRHPATKDRADECLYRLSLGLNVSSLGNLARERFAASVRRSLQRASRVEALTVPLFEWARGSITSETFFERVIGS